MVEFHTLNMLYLYHHSRAYLARALLNLYRWSWGKKKKAEDIQLGQKNYLAGSLI